MSWKEQLLKYITKGKKPKWVTRFHRTERQYTPNIDREGLRANSPNKGKNTAVTNPKDLENVWLADNRYEIPVLRRYGSSPDVTTYKVRIPYELYWNDMKRNTMPHGRSGGKFKAVKPRQPSMFSEGKYRVDLIGQDIPPQYLQKLPTYANSKPQLMSDLYHKLEDYDASAYVEENIENLTKNLPKRMRGEAQQFLDNYLQMDDSKVHLPSEEFIKAMFPSNKYENVVKFTRAYDDVAKNNPELSPAAKLKKTLSDEYGITELPTELDKQLSWQIYEPGVWYPNEVGNTSIHSGAISRAIDAEPTKPIAETWANTKQKVHNMLERNNRFREADGQYPISGYERKADSLFAIPIQYAAETGGPVSELLAKRALDNLVPPDKQADAFNHWFWGSGPARIDWRGGHPNLIAMPKAWSDILDHQWWFKHK